MLKFLASALRGGFMDINTGKLSSGSSFILKKLKETDLNGKVNSNENDYFAKEKLLNDFADIRFNDKFFKSRIINNNRRLSDYENSLSEIQFIEQKINILETLNIDSDKEAIKEVIDGSVYNRKNVIKDFFPDLENFNEGLQSLKESVNEKNSLLSEELKRIEVASQNIISTNFKSFLVNEESIMKLDKEKIEDTIDLSNKKVMELIS
jgi:hypothetical protein